LNRSQLSQDPTYFVNRRSPLMDILADELGARHYPMDMLFHETGRDNLPLEGPVNPRLFARRGLDILQRANRNESPIADCNRFDFRVPGVHHQEFPGYIDRRCAALVHQFSGNVLE